ncbi:single-stranded DNA-binding protein [Candidatus Bipolaricaulota bacterium]|nr:single-stranded DNA-binding protein [Candidatus Bipolaricaulota bacterium]
MTASLNRVILIGNLTADPELKYTPSGKALTKFRIAINNQYKDASGSLQEDVTFVPITVWGAQAESCSNYLIKGRPVAVEGRLRVSTYENESGEKRTFTEVVASKVQFLGGAPRSGDAPAQTAVPPSSSKPEASTTEEVPF